MDGVRQVRSSANYSVFNGGYFDDVSAVQIEKAPGFITSFAQLPEDFMFDEVECVYGGQFSNDSLKICVRQMDQGVAAGRLTPSIHNPVC
jgi:hypothetical protein